MKLLTQTILLIAISLPSFSQTLLISDIDDTIKVSHIRSLKGAISNAFRTNNIFKGMADLYKATAKDSDAKIFYLTNAPEKILGYSHKLTLRNGKFPAGQLLLRKSGVSPDTHKVVELERLLTEYEPETVILLGDNGEKDIHFYKDTMMKFPKVKFVTFIRIAYSPDSMHTPRDGQYGFVSPFEIASKLYTEGLLSFRSIQHLYNIHAPAFLKEKLNKEKGPMYLPKWQTCKSHKFDQSKDSFNHYLSKAVSRKINRVCNFSFI